MSEPYLLVISTEYIIAIDKNCMIFLLIFKGEDFPKEFKKMFKRYYSLFFKY